LPADRATIGSVVDRTSRSLPDSRDGGEASPIRDCGRRAADRLFVLSAFLLFGATAAVVFWQNSRLTILWDLSYILENASRMAAGQRPYRDFPFPYAPLTFLTQALIIRLTGRVVWHHALYAAVAGGGATVAAFVMARRLVRFEGRGAVVIAALLAAPLAVLGIYSIVPHPFYDPDACLAVLVLLVCLTGSEPAREAGREMKGSFTRSLALGAAIAIPLLIKQNIGLAFVVSTAGALSIVSLKNRFTPDGTQAFRRRADPRALLAGIALGIALVVGLLTIFFGLSDTIRWTIRFAAARRLPPLSQQLDIYSSPPVWIWLATFLVGVALARLRGRFEFWQRLGGALLMSAPWLCLAALYFTTDDSVEWEIELLALWPFVMLLALLATVFAIRRSGLTMESLLPLIVVATIHGTFLSQGTWGSTYGIWPLLVLLLAFAIGAAEIPFPTAMIVSSIVGMTMLVVGADYIATGHRLIYAKIADGPPVRSTIPALRGMTMRGRWLPDFEELVAFTDREVPRDDAILSMPGEDLFYFTTGRVPQFPVLMFDRTINPYSPSEIAALAEERRVGWIIMKKHLQVNGDPMPELGQTLSLLSPRYQLVRRLANYDIYRRSAPAHARRPHARISGMVSSSDLRQ
jgi:hypothetical protein